MQKLMVLIISVFVVSINGAPEGRMTGGTIVNPGEFPFVVSVTVDGNPVCGGFIYNNQFVVTAASCVVTYKTTPARVKVTVGMLSQTLADPYELTYIVSNVTPHASYNTNTKLNDIALLRTSDPIDFNNGVYYVPYDEVDPTITTGWIMGWGATINGGTPSTKLRKAQLTFSTGCSSYGSSYDERYMTCAGSTTSSPCQYDEGSPLVQVTAQGNIAVGIMSKNNGCGTGYLPTVFTRLSAYFSWLKGIAGYQPTPTTTAAPTTVPTAACSGCVTGR